MLELASLVAFISLVFIAFLITMKLRINYKIKMVESMRAVDPFTKDVKSTLNQMNLNSLRDCNIGIVVSTVCFVVSMILIVLKEVR